MMTSTVTELGQMLMRTEDGDSTTCQQQEYLMMMMALKMIVNGNDCDKIYRS